MNNINEIGDTTRGQEMLGRTAERAYQRAQRTSGADKKRYMRTYDDVYKTSGKSSNKHLGGSREHFDNGRDYEYEKWADEHNGNVTESKNMNKKLIRLTENDLHKIVKESVDKILSESEIGDRVNALKGMSRTYKKDLTDNDNELSKTWNRGMGLQSFIEVLPDEGVILYNSLQTYNRDLQRIKQVFPEYKLVKVDKPYYSHSSLRAHRNGTAIY